MKFLNQLNTKSEGEKINFSDAILTIVIPAKNAASYVKRTIGSISEQSISSMVKIKVVYAESEDNTESILINELSDSGLSFEIVHDNRPLNIALLEAFMTIETKYTVFMCLSDQYILSTYLENAVCLLENDKYSRSFCHANILTGIPRNGGYIYTNGMYSRMLYQPADGAGFYANFAYHADSISELTLVYRASTLKNILKEQRYKSCLKSNVIGSIFMETFAHGLIGHYMPVYSTIGYHHQDSRNANKKIQLNDSAWVPLYEVIREQIRNQIDAHQFKWNKPDLTPYPQEQQCRFYEEYSAQLSILNSALKVINIA